MSANTLARLWLSRGFAPDRLLFVTFEFNFRDFHDQVLRRLLENAGGRIPYVDVIASRVDLEEESDCFDFRYLAPFGNHFRLFRCNSFPVAHAKGIIARDSRTGRTLSGIGSANLTPSGWRRNIEMWSWDTGQSTSSIIQMCEALGHTNGIAVGLVAEWRKSFSVKKVASSVFVLGGSHAPSFENVVDRLTTIVPRPRVVRVASPYFDPHSNELFSRIFLKTGRCRLEIWTDRSGRLAEPTHWRVLSKTLPKLAKKFGDVQVLAPPREIPWHAKVIELDDGHGNIARAYGSANFTGAGWGVRHRGNLELVAIVASRAGLPDLLDARKIKMTAVGKAERKRLTRQEDHEQIRRAKGPELLWACLVEKPNAQVLARLARPEKLTWWRLHAEFDESRPDDERERLKKVRQFVSERARWQLRQSGCHIVLDWMGDEFTACERMTLKIKTASGSCSAPVWVPEPDWSKRDRATGIPIAPQSDEWSIDAFLRGQRPIVGLRRKDRDLEQDEEISAELNTAPEPPMWIEHPDYDHEPELVLIARRFRDSPAAVKDMKQRLEIIARKGRPKDRLLANVILTTSENK
ncbi:MAG: hypothetical protein NDI90_16030 [Nitrospira sp. BO4]|jgi:hypothetical protein|nr:hypothetical protein [Nitrospira sp. BO4]